jgi:phosphoglycolate phosphatase-like HAD superfamily hydrolase
MLRLITDFDGPIIDVSERYYQVYLLCLEKTRRSNQTVQELSKAEFWRMKRSRISETQIAITSGFDDAQVADFVNLRKQTVHTQPYFQYDTLIPGAVEALLKVQQAGVDLLVMTMRRVRELDYALEKFDLERFFPENRRYCLTNDYVKTRDVEDKPLLMARALNELLPVANTWMVGDTEADIASAKKYNIKVMAVESGIRDRLALEFFQPDLIVKDFASSVDLFLHS